MERTTLESEVYCLTAERDDPFQQMKSMPTKRDELEQKPEVLELNTAMPDQEL